tara:strand:+ start:18776 stop:19813 length:1038 start_codon:yes stop_codon:yes gene_type:complete
MKKRVVIVGGGFAGSKIAKKLENSFDVTLIDNKDYFEFTPSVLRTIVEPQHAKKIQILHKNYLNKAVIVKGDIIGVTKKEVITPKHTVSYDYLVICTGSDYNSPIKEKDMVIAARAKELVSYANKLKKAKSVLIIGGGLVGVELAAEIIEKYPDKKITIIHGSKELIERNPEKARNYAYNFFKERDVNIIFNELVKGKTNKTFKTNKGKKITADLVFSCIGIKPNSECLKGSCSKSLDKKSCLCVNKYLQVKDLQNVFAAGDITNIEEEKLAQNAEKHAEIVVNNIIALENSKELTEYKPKPRIMVISLGKKNGILVYKNFVITGIVPGILKGFIEWWEMGKYKI